MSPARWWGYERGKASAVSVEASCASGPFHSSRGGSVPLSCTGAVTENMLHDAVSSAHRREQPSSACIGPLDNGAMRAAMRWQSLASLHGTLAHGRGRVRCLHRRRSIAAIDEPAARTWIRGPSSHDSRLLLRGDRCSRTSAVEACVGRSGAATHMRIQYSTCSYPPRNNQTDGLHALAISKAPPKVARGEVYPANSAHRASYDDLSVASGTHVS